MRLRRTSPPDSRVAPGPILGRVLGLCLFFPVWLAAAAGLVLVVHGYADGLSG